MLKNPGCCYSSSVGELGVSLHYPGRQTFSVITDCTAPIEEEEKPRFKKERSKEQPSK